MNLQAYLDRKQKDISPRRSKCGKCWQPTFACYCADIEPLQTQTKFVILIHPLEMRRRIATGRMAHLCLAQSEIVAGTEFSQDKRVNDWIQSDQYRCVVLHPGAPSLNLSLLTEAQRSSYVVAEEKPLLIFVVDGTWATAKKMLRLSPNLLALPRLCFTPQTPSQFRVRKQPRPEYHSTIEAIHQILLLLEPSITLSCNRLLQVFDRMVERQLGYVNSAPPPRYPRQQK